MENKSECLYCNRTLKSVRVVKLGDTYVAECETCLYRSCPMLSAETALSIHNKMLEILNLGFQVEKGLKTGGKIKVQMPNWGVEEFILTNVAVDA